MNCEKCGAQLPEDVNKCPECGTEVSEAVKTAESAESAPAEHTAVRSQTIPQRPRTAYPDRSASRQAARHRRNMRTVRLVILVIVIAALLAAAIFVGTRIVKHGQEEPDLGDNDQITAQPEQNDEETSDKPAEDDIASEETEEAIIYDLTGVWVWDADMALMKETVWHFAEDGTVMIYYFGMENPENPFDAWPTEYTYEIDTGILTLAGERIPLIWKNENSFTLHSAVLGICDGKKTDVDHIPTGAEDIRKADGNMPDVQEPDENTEENSNPDADSYLFADSSSRYLKKSELDALTADELRLARNEIYARYGRMFDSEDLQSYFNSKNWYKATTAPEDFNYDILNDYERYNVNLMRSVEDAKR